MHLCLNDLAQLVGGTIHFGPMPPKDGAWTTIGRIALDSRLVEPGDVFWRLPGFPWQTACSPQHALFRGAAGVVAPGTGAKPWPGTFCLEVENALTALAHLLDFLDESAISKNPAELKVLQLCRYQGLDITPPTCGRMAAERHAGQQAGRRCRQRAA